MIDLFFVRVLDTYIVVCESYEAKLRKNMQNRIGKQVQDSFSYWPMVQNLKVKTSNIFSTAASPKVFRIIVKIIFCTNHPGQDFLLMLLSHMTLPHVKRIIIFESRDSKFNNIKVERKIVDTVDSTVLDWQLQKIGRCTIFQFL